MNLFSLSGTLKLDTSDFVEKLNDARKSVDEFVKYLQSVGKGSGLDGVSETAKDAGDAVEEVGDKAESAQPKVKNFWDVLKEMHEKVPSLSDALKNVGGEMQTIGDSMEKVFSPIANVARDAIDGWIEYESAFTGVRKTSEGTEEQFAALDAGIRALSTTTASSKVEIAGAAEVVGQLTDNIEDVLPLTETAIKIADTTNISLNEGAAAITRLMTIMGDGSDMANAYGSALVELGNNTATDEKQILNMALRIAGAGYQVGMTGDQVLALSAGLSALGIRAEAGGSSISRVLLSMGEAARIGVEPTQELLGKARDALIEMKVAAAQKNGLDVAAEDFADLTVSVRDLQLMMENSPSDFRKLADAMGMTKTEVAGIIDGSVHLQEFADVAGVSADEFAQAIQEDAYSALLMFLGGLEKLDDEGASAYSVLQGLDLNTIRVRDSLLRGAAGYEEMMKAASMSHGAFEEGKALEEEAALRYGEMASRIHQLKETFSNLAIEVGENLMPLVERAMEWGYKIIDFLDQLPDGMLETIAQIGLFGAAAGGLISNIGGWVKALGTLGGALTGPVGIAVAVAGVVAAVALGGEELVANVESTVGDISEKLPGFIENIVTGFTENFPRLIELALELVMTLATGIGDALPELIPAAVDMLLTIVETLTDPNTLVGLVDAALAIILGLTEGIIRALPDLIAAVPEIIKNIVQTLIELSPRLFATAAELILQLVEGILASLPEVITGAGEIMAGLVGAVIEGVPQMLSAGKDLVIGLWEGIKEKADWTYQRIKEWWEGLLGKFKSLLGIHSPSTVFADIGDNLVKGLWNGINDKAQWIKDKISGWVDSVTGWFKNLFGISSPSKVFAQMGRFLDEGLGVGIEDNIGVVTNAVRDLSDATTDAWDSELGFSGVRPPAFGYSTAPMSAPSLTGGGSGSSADERPINIVVQSVLDGKVIGESTYKYAQQRNRVLGRAFA